MISRMSRAAALLGMGMAALLTLALVPAAWASSGAAAPAPGTADPGNESYLLTSSAYSISPAHTKTITASCGSGWYVRPAQPSAFAPATDLNVALIVHKDSTWIINEGTTAKDYYNKPGSIFATFDIVFYNESLIHSHSVSFQWWCDKVPTWYSTTAPGGATPTAGQPAAGVGPGCYYCSLDEKLTNLGTGQVLDSSNAANGAAVMVAAPGGQNQDWYLQGNSGNADFLNNVATFGIWRSKELLNLAIAEDPGTKNVHYVSTNGASIPSYGQWYYIDRGAGSPLGAVMLVNTQTTDCLAAPGGAGSPVVVVPCDATDKTQWWVAS